jgi:hypothetical protein
MGEKRLAAFRQRWKATGSKLPLSVHMGVLEPMPPLLACSISHQQALASATGPVLIFEDDAVFKPEFTLDLDFPKNAEMVRLGGEHMDFPKPAKSPFVLATDVRLFHAYIVYDPQALAARWPEPSMKWELAVNALGLVTYALDPFTVGQAAGRSGITLQNRHHDAYWNAKPGTLMDWDYS